MVAAFSKIFPDLPLSCSFLILILFHGMVRCVALNGKSYPPSSALPSQEGVLPRTTDFGWISFLHLLTQSIMEVFSCPQGTLSPRIGPLSQHIHKFGLPGLSPPHLPLRHPPWPYLLLNDNHI